MRAGGATVFLEIFNSKKKSEDLVANKVRWDERQRQRVASKKVRARS